MKNFIKLLANYFVALLVLKLAEKDDSRRIKQATSGKSYPLRAVAVSDHDLPVPYLLPTYTY